MQIFMRKKQCASMETGSGENMSVTDTGNFDINVAGDYEISYALTEKESSVSETESVENTESADIIESTDNSTH